MISDRWRYQRRKGIIPVVVSVSGMTDLVYNDFYVADGADVTIVAGCGIHNSGCNESRHDGIQYLSCWRKCKRKI